MADELAVETEILKLARLLQREPGRLAYLKRVPLNDLKTLRAQMTETLFTDHESVLRRLAAASRLLPVALVAGLSENTFGPILSARIAGLMDPERADQVGQRLPTRFVADVAIELDPRRASDVIARIAPDRISDITAELVRRREYVTMGRFVGHLDDGPLEAAIKALSDDDLVETLSVMEEAPELDRLARLTDPERIERLAARPDSPISRL